MQGILLDRMVLGGFWERSPGKPPCTLQSRGSLGFVAQVLCLSVSGQSFRLQVCRSTQVQSFEFGTLAKLRVLGLFAVKPEPSLPSPRSSKTWFFQNLKSEP